MKKTTLPLVAILLLSLIIIVPAFGIKDPPGAMHMVYGSIGEPETIDPAWSYDTASGSVIFNVYDTLIVFDGESIEPPYRAGLATSWTVTDIDETDPDTGVHWIAQYDFTIRTGAQFHTGGTVAPSDVEYSIERNMVQDRSGGPNWMFFLPLLDGWGSRDLDVGNSTHPGPEVDLMGMMIDHAVSSNDGAGTVTIKAANKFDWIWQVLSQAWASVVSKAWATTIPNEWDGVWGDHTGWIVYNNPAVSPIDALVTYPPPVSVDGGSGPFTIDYWNKGTEWSIVRFEDYWGGWPASYPVTGGIAPMGYVDRFTEKYIADWASRKPQFIAGDLDLCDIPRSYVNDPDILAEVAAGRVEVVMPIPTLSLGSFHFNFAIDGASAYLPEMPTGTPSTTFFADIHVRRGFAYAMNWTKHILEYWLGEAVQPTSWHIEGLAGPSIPNKYSCDLTKVQEEFKLAFGGSLGSPGPAWTGGFTAIIMYNEGNLARKNFCEIMEANIEAAFAAGGGATIDIVPTAVPWSTYLGLMVAKQNPAWGIGWLADFAHPDNFARPYMHSLGDFSYFQSYNNATVDMMIDTAVKLPLEDATAQAYYWELQLEFYRSVPTIAMYQGLGRHYEQAWVQGWYYNSLYPGPYVYNQWKQDLTPGNVNYDGIVDMRDIGAIGRAFGSYPGHSRWNFRCDLNGDRKVDMRDIGIAARNFGKSSPTWP